MKFCHKVGLTYVSCSLYRPARAGSPASQPPRPPSRKSAPPRRSPRRSKPRPQGPPLAKRRSFRSPSPARAKARRGFLFSQTHLRTQPHQVPLAEPHARLRAVSHSDLFAPWSPRLSAGTAAGFTDTPQCRTLSITPIRFVGVITECGRRSVRLGQTGITSHPLPRPPAVAPYANSAASSDSRFSSGRRRRDRQ